MLNRWLATLERRYGRFTVPNVTYPLVFAMAVIYVLVVTNPGLLQWLVLDRDAIMRGQLWRLVTFALLPPSFHPVFVVFELLFLHTMGNALESSWGTFRYQIYLGVGWLGVVAVAMLSGAPTSNAMLLASVLFAFATLFPEYEIRVLFLIPVPIKWIAVLAGLGVLAMIGTANGLERLYPVVAIGNYLLFFWVELVDLVRGYTRRAGRAQKFGRFRSDVRAGSERARRVCARCGVTDADPSIDFRVCSCDKCKSPTDFCLEHSRDH